MLPQTSFLVNQLYKHHQLPVISFFLCTYILYIYIYCIDIYIYMYMNMYMYIYICIYICIYIYIPATNRYAPCIYGLVQQLHLPSSRRQEVRQRSCSASRRQKQIRRQEKLKAWERPGNGQTIGE